MPGIIVIDKSHQGQLNLSSLRGR